MPEIPEGVVVGGWSYVVAAYTLTGLGLLVYAWSLILRHRKLRQEDEQHEH